MFTAWVLHRIYHPPRRALAFALARQLPLDPGAMGLTFTNRTFALPDGTTSPAWVITGRDPRGPVLLVTHAWSDTRYRMLTQLGPLPELCSRIVIYDLRGHGESSAGASHSGATEAADILAILDALGPLDRPLLLLGFSLGAGASIVAAADDPRHRIAGVIAVAPPRFYGPPIAELIRRFGLPKCPLNWLVSAHLAVWLQSPRNFDRAAYAARLTCPLLILHGANDGMVPVAAARQVAAAAPHGELVDFPTAGHLDLAQVDAARYFDALRRFVADTPR
jgi:pimeloyl-ACP methyl ester carboxylesterase